MAWNGPEALYEKAKVHSLVTAQFSAASYLLTVISRTS
jgi:hypothetical protein